MKGQEHLLFIQNDLAATQAGGCRRVSPRKTNKSLHYKRILRVGRGIQTHEPRYFNGLPGRVPWWYRSTRQCSELLPACSIRICLSMTDAADYDSVELPAPLTDLTRHFAQPTGTFTPELPASRSPFSSSGITTVAT